jgi:branched-chain amino acid transport system substrate-binding protein
MSWLSKLETDVLYFPVYTVDAVNIMNQVAARKIPSVLITSDSLFSADFIDQTGEMSRGMYLSGPASLNDPEQFARDHLARYNEEPLSIYHLQAYDALVMLLTALENVALPAEGGGLLIPRQALRVELQSVRGQVGLSGTLTCSEFGDCAEPVIEIFQVQNRDFVEIYP